MLRLTLLAPDLVEVMLYGRALEGVSLAVLMESLPACWPKQLATLDYGDGGKPFVAITASSSGERFLTE